MKTATRKPRKLKHGLLPTAIKDLDDVIALDLWLTVNRDTQERIARDQDDLLRLLVPQAAGVLREVECRIRSNHLAAVFRSGLLGIEEL